MQKQLSKRPAKSRVKITIKSTSKSMRNGGDKALITQLAILLDND